MEIILISGKAQSGKDTFANLLKKELKSKNKRVLITHYADLLKYIAKTFFDWNGKKDEYGRYLLQNIGTDVIRKENPNYWVNFINDMIGFCGNLYDYILIPDTRFPNEVDLVKKRYENKVMTIKMNRQNFESKLTKEQQQHSSETALDDYMFDLIVYNNTLDELKQSAEKISEILAK